MGVRLQAWGWAGSVCLTPHSSLEQNVGSKQASLHWHTYHHEAHGKQWLAGSVGTRQGLHGCMQSQMMQANAAMLFLLGLQALLLCDM